MIPRIPSPKNVWEGLKSFGGKLYNWWAGPDPSAARLAAAHAAQRASIQARQRQASQPQGAAYGFGDGTAGMAAAYYDQARAAAQNALAQYRAALRHHLSQALAILGTYGGIGQDYLQREMQDMADFIAASTQAGMSTYEAGQLYGMKKLAEMLSAQREAQLEPMVYHVGVPPSPETRREQMATDIVSPMELLETEGQQFRDLMETVKTAYGARGEAQERAAEEYVKALREAFGQYSAREAAQLQTLAGMKEAEAAYNTGALLAQLAAQQSQMLMAQRDPLLGLKAEAMQLDIAQQKRALQKAMENERIAEILSLADAMGRPGLTEQEFNEIKKRYLDPFLADPTISETAKFTLRRIFDEYWARKGNYSFQWIAGELFSVK